MVEERNQQDATNLVFIIKLLSEHVSGIIMPISRRTTLCITAYGVLHCNKRDMESIWSPYPQQST